MCGLRKGGVVLTAGVAEAGPQREMGVEGVGPCHVPPGLGWDGGVASGRRREGAWLTRTFHEGGRLRAARHVDGRSRGLQHRPQVGVRVLGGGLGVAVLTNVDDLRRGTVGEVRSAGCRLCHCDWTCGAGCDGQLSSMVRRGTQCQRTHLCVRRRKGGCHVSVLLGHLGLSNGQGEHLDQGVTGDACSQPVGGSSSQSAGV